MLLSRIDEFLQAVELILAKFPNEFIVLNSIFDLPFTNSYPEQPPEIKMSDYLPFELQLKIIKLPFELQLEIIKRLPVKELLQFRSFSKQWKAFIDSSEFINSYSLNQTQLPRRLVWYQDEDISQSETGETLVTFVDDETLNPISANTEIDPTALGLAKQYKDLRVIGSSHGLLCLYSRPSFSSETGMAALWNPSIRKSVGVAVPRQLGWGFSCSILGFGVNPITSDPTIVNIPSVSQEMNSMAAIEVFTLSTGTWRSLRKLPDKPFTVSGNSVTTGKFIYWFAFQGMVNFRCGSGAKKLITSFDMTTQEIRQIDLPDCFAHRPYMRFSISEVRGSLAVLEFCRNSQKRVCDIWMRNHDDPNLFTKLFTINTPYTSIRILGFMKSGGPIMATQPEDDEEPGALVFYEPSSKDLNHSAIYANYYSFFVDSYMETLLLLDQPNSN
ncbi:hypothetical protein LXL04_015102 [Taraxacum kok-saghyz]